MFLLSCSAFLWRFQLLETDTPDYKRFWDQTGAKFCVLWSISTDHLNQGRVRAKYSKYSECDVYSWVVRGVTKNQTKKLSILLSFYFHEVLQYLNTFI